MQSAQTWITQCYLQLHQRLPLACKCSPDGASPNFGCAHLIAAYYSFIYPERLSRPGWLTYCGRFTHISGHWSAAGGAQDGESSADQRPTFYHGAMQPTTCVQLLCCSILVIVKSTCTGNALPLFCVYIYHAAFRWAHVHEPN